MKPQKPPLPSSHQTEGYRDHIKKYRPKSTNLNRQRKDEFGK